MEIYQLKFDSLSRTHPVLPVFLSFPPKMRQHERSVCQKQFLSVIRFFAGEDISRKIDKF